jgi:hypothetical protein
MTAPVTASRSDEDYVVSFTMPSGYSMEDLPLPNNPAVRLESVGAHVVAAVRFNGNLSEKNAISAQNELQAWVRDQGLVSSGEPVAAQYDAPWKPGFARHNEILIPVEDAPSDLK